MVALALVDNFVFCADTWASLVHRLTLVVLRLKPVLVRHLVWLNKHSHLVALTISLERVLLGADDVVAVRISLTGVRYALVGVILDDSWLGNLVRHELARVFEVDFAFRDLVWISSLFGVCALLKPDDFLADFVSLGKVGFIGCCILCVLVQVLLSAVPFSLLGAVDQVFALQFVWGIPISFNLNF